MNLMPQACEGIDLASLADIVVADLAIMRRTGQKSKDGLDRAIELCDRLALPLSTSQLPPPTLENPEAARRQLHTIAPTEASRGETNSEEVVRIKTELRRLSEDTGDIRSDELARIQEFIVQATTSSWQERAHDFQQRRLKRGLKQQSLRDR